MNNLLIEHKKILSGDLAFHLIENIGRVELVDILI